MSEINASWKELRPQIGEFLNQLDNLSKGMDKKMEQAYRAGVADAWAMAQHILSMTEEEAEQVFDDTDLTANVLDCSADEAAMLLYEQANADYELAKYRRGTYGNMMTLMGIKTEAEKKEDRYRDILAAFHNLSKALDDLGEATK